MDADCPSEARLTVTTTGLTSAPRQSPAGLDSGARTFFLYVPTRALTTPWASFTPLSTSPASWELCVSSIAQC